MKNEKPYCPLVGANGNIFNLVAIAQKTLERNNKSKETKELFDRVRETHSYDEALRVIFEYVIPCTQEEYEYLMELKRNHQEYEEIDVQTLK